MLIKDNFGEKTIDSFISKSLPNSVQFQNASYYTVVDGRVMEDFNLFRDRYYAQLLSYTEKLSMTNEEFEKYKYRPKKLSASLYRCTDYWYILLIINKMSSILQFKKKNILVLNTDGIRFIKYVLKKEEDEIDQNKLSINAKIADLSK